MIALYLVAVMANAFFLIETEADVCSDIGGGTCITKDCCSAGYYTTGVCSNTTLVCCLSNPDCNWKQKQHDAKFWPKGIYTIPRTANDCPRYTNGPWLPGQVSVNLASTQMVSTSPKFDLMGPVSDRNITFGFCTKIEGTLDTDSLEREIDWPKGTYCIFPASIECPKEFIKEQISFDIDGTNIKVEGKTPIAVNESLVNIRLCCREDGNISTSVTLYTAVPFTLIKKGEYCQQVENMKTFEEYLEVKTWDEKSPNSSVTKTRMTFCYYKEYETCYLKDDGGTSYRGSVSFTAHGKCPPWDTYATWNPWSYLHYNYVLRDNHCTSTKGFKPSPQCQMKDLQYVECGIPPCDNFSLRDLKKLRKDYPARQMQGDRELAMLAMDGMPGTCSEQTSVHRAWWQVDLQKVEQVVALAIISGKGGCFLRLASITLGMQAEDHFNGAGIYCHKNFSMASGYIVIKCEQPVSGRFLTLQDSDHWQHDIRKNLTEYHCLYLCEIAIYTNASVTTCGDPLSIGQILPSSQVEVSSNGNDLLSTVLYAHPGWCAHHKDTQPYILINLFKITQVTAFISQGSSSDVSQGYVTNFHVKYGINVDHLKYITGFDGSKTVFTRNISVSSHTPVTHTLYTPTNTRYMKFEMMEWKNNACFRVKVIGCKSQQANLARSSKVTASSKLGSGTPSMLIDGLLETCFRTALEHRPWINITLAKTYAVEGVILRNDFTMITNMDSMCVDKSNAGSTYAGSVSHTEEGLPCQRWDAQTPHTHGQGNTTFPEKNLTLAGNYCRNPDFGNTVWCYTLNPDIRVQFCSVPYCEDYSSSLTVSTSDSEVWDICTNLVIKGKQEYAVALCNVTKAAHSILISANEVQPIFLQFCEVDIIGFHLEAPKVTKTNTQEIWTCPEGHEISLTHNAEEGISLDVLITGYDEHYLQNFCIGTATCIIPTQWHQINPNYIDYEYELQRVVCSPVDDDTCVYTIKTPGPFLSKNDYLRIYDSRDTCTWQIQSPTENMFPQLNISKIILAQQEIFDKEGTQVIDPGTCKDELVISYNIPKSGTETIITLQINEPMLFISPVQKLSVSLSSCLRLKPTIVKDIDLEAKYGLTECPGCAVQKSCSGVQSCSTSCGNILSPAFPQPYANDIRCVWMIVVEESSYIQLEFKHFDIFEMNSPICMHDYVSIFNEEPDGVSGKHLIESFCNTNTPPKMIISKWNRLTVEMVTDSSQSAGGIWAVYKSIKFNNDLVFGSNETGCKQGWLDFQDNCYKLTKNKTGISWINAEGDCLRQGSHLASILSDSEMYFIHNLLIHEEVYASSVYIGLTDSSQEGVWRWTDGLPVAFTNWHQNSVNGVFQPNGSTLENCGSIELDGLRPSKNWHDVVCSFKASHYYLCKTTHRESNSTLSLPLYNAQCPSDLFPCTNQECILPTFQCDGHVDCSDGSDEENCGTCSPDSFMCADQSCIPLAFVCDFKRDCADGSDETDCVHSPCLEDQFSCSNGQCIFKDMECNLIRDCWDGSDEVSCGTCQNAFQCYDGTCLPSTMVCDGVGDCPGIHSEDETSCRKNRYKSCLDYRKGGYTTNGKYVIYPDAKEAATVECDFTSSPSEVITIVHHNSEQKILNSNHGGVASYTRNISYFIPHFLIPYIKHEALRCEQYMWFECYFAPILLKAYWINIKSERKPYLTDDPSCVCPFRQRACDELGKTWGCVCQYTRRYHAYDYGYLRDMEDLPVMGITLSHTSHTAYGMHQMGPLTCYHDYNASEVTLLCANQVPYNNEEKCLYDVDAYGLLTTCRDGTHLRDCTSASCPKDYVKCPASYCIPVRLICDGQVHCPGGEDEDSCGTYSCPGQFHCKETHICLAWNQRCDGVTHCPHGDDELFCDLLCPNTCDCHMSKVICTETNLTSLPNISSSVRVLNLTHNNIQIEPYMFQLYIYMMELYLRHNSIINISSSVFEDLYNLVTLDLAYNMIYIITEGTFHALSKLKTLILIGNKISVVEPFAFRGLDRIETINLTGMYLEKLEFSTFSGVSKLKSIDLSNNILEVIETDAFNGVEDIQYLYIQGNRITTFDHIDLQSLSNLKYLYSDDYMFCCLTNMDTAHCMPQPDELSSCTDLMKNNGLRAFLWILGIMAVVGNSFCLLYHMFGGEKPTVTTNLTRNLATADLLFGCYMLAIASVDAYYRGDFIANASKWKASYWCQILGFLATLSTEASVLTLLTITCDRLRNIASPFAEIKLTVKSSRYAMALVWSVAFLIALIPLIPSDYFNGQFYSRTSVCVSIHMTKDTPPGWEYSVAIFHGLNLSAFLVIFVSYVYMYNKIRKSAKLAKSKTGLEMAAAQKMALIVLTDFCCWFPINVMGIMAMSNISIPGEIYAWTIVFVLPVNSAVNPILYTISTLRLKRLEKPSKYSVDASKSATSVIEIGTGSQVTQSTTMKKFIAENSSNISLLYKVILQTARVMSSIHDNDMAIGSLTNDQIYIHEGEKVTILVGGGQNIKDGDFSKEDDVEQFGKIVAQALRAHTLANK